MIYVIALRQAARTGDRWQVLPRAAGFSLRSNPGLPTPPRPSLSFFGRLYRES